ncbi:hypothetical protein FOA52_005604 [Chlamydomonas sp. UWO 241]|nr:hypothetical protein FOA52_005604 [Chlamydomonas sp. UWO 241]
MREQKDPSSFSSMDEMREYLHDKEDRSQVTIGNVLTFLSQASMGSGPSLQGDAAGAASSSEPSADGGRRQAAGPFAAARAMMLRGIAAAYREFVWRIGSVVRHRYTALSQEEEEAKWPVVDAAKFARLEPMLGGVLITIRSLRKAAYKYPALLEMEPAEMAVRLVTLKEVLSGCDIAHLVEQEPQLYLGGQPEEVAQRVGAAFDMMSARLAGADVHAVIILDPGLLFMPELSRGLDEFRDLWDVDDAALAASSPQMLALAVRALSVTGLPKGL